MIGLLWAILGVAVMCLAGILWVAIELDAFMHAWQEEHPCVVTEYPDSEDEDEFGDEFDDISVEERE